MLVVILSVTQRLEVYVSISLVVGYVPSKSRYMHPVISFYLSVYVRMIRSSLFLTSRKFHDAIKYLLTNCLPFLNNTYLESHRVLHLSLRICWQHDSLWCSFFGMALLRIIHWLVIMTTLWLSDISCGREFRMLTATNSTGLLGGDSCS